jgi:hypothetical protein
MNDIFMRIEEEVIRFYEGLIPFLDKHFQFHTHKNNTPPHDNTQSKQPLVYTHSI